jgi:cytochrome d ubiquinol oxidase subunit I
MNSAVGLDRLQFAFTVTFHYIFPHLTIGLALLIVALKVLVLAKRNELYSDLARFWMRIFAVNFAMGSRNRHPYGIPIRHELGRVFGTAGGACQLC